MNFHSMFYTDHHLRPGWRLLAWLLLALVFFAAGVFLTALALHVFHWKLSPTGNLYGMVGLQAAATLGAAWVIDPVGATRRVAPTISSVRDFAWGWLFAFMVMALMFGMLYGRGWLQVVGVGPLPWRYVPLLMLVGFYEEVLFRGFILRTAADGAGKLRPCVGIVVSAIAFGLAHINNPSRGLAPFLGITLAGLAFGWTYVKYGSLWLLIGLHFGWDLFEGLVFGFPTSGLNFPAVLTLQIHGPQVWTGGAFGPEAGLILLPGLCLGAGLVWWYMLVGREISRPYK